jgi:hypothetical protein
MLKLPKVAPSQVTGGTFLEMKEQNPYMKYLNELRAFSHKVAPSDSIPQHLYNGLRSKPYDVFLIHAGEQKESADTMKRLFEAGNLHCFLDKDMKDGASPTEEMRAAIQSCRYTVVILSECFVRKKHPCTELQFAYDRLMWIRNNCQHWNSLRIICYELIVDDYESLREQSPYKPPSLAREINIKEWTGERSKSWWQVCLELKVSLIEEDMNYNAVENWHELLTKICQSDQDGFPSTDDLY